MDNFSKKLRSGLPKGFRHKVVKAHDPNDVDVNNLQPYAQLQNVLRNIEDTGSSRVQLPEIDPFITAVRQWNKVETEVIELKKKIGSVNWAEEALQNIEGLHNQFMDMGKKERGENYEENPVARKLAHDFIVSVRQLEKDLEEDRGENGRKFLYVSFGMDINKDPIDRVRSKAAACLTPWMEKQLKDEQKKLKLYETTQLRFIDHDSIRRTKNNIEEINKNIEHLRRFLYYNKGSVPDSWLSAQLQVKAEYERSLQDSDNEGY